MLQRAIGAFGHGFCLTGSIQSLGEKRKVFKVTEQAEKKNGLLETSDSSSCKRPQKYVIWEKNLGRTRLKRP